MFSVVAMCFESECSSMLSLHSGLYFRFFQRSEKKTARSFLSCQLGKTGMVSRYVGLIMCKTAITLSEITHYRLSLNGNIIDPNPGPFQIHAWLLSIGEGLRYNVFSDKATKHISWFTGAGTAYPSRAPEFTPSFSGIRVTWYVV